MKVTDDMTFKRTEGVIGRGGQEELLLFHSALGKLYEVNSVGRILWQLLDGERTVEEIKEELRKRYGNIREIDDDVSDFLSRLLEHNLISPGMI